MINQKKVIVNLSQRVLSATLYAIIMTKATIKGSFGDNIYCWTRNQNSRHKAVLIIEIEENEILKFKELSGLEVLEIDKATLNLNEAGKMTVHERILWVTSFIRERSEKNIDTEFIHILNQIPGGASSFIDLGISLKEFIEILIEKKAIIKREQFFTVPEESENDFYTNENQITFL